MRWWLEAFICSSKSFCVSEFGIFETGGKQLFWAHAVLKLYTAQILNLDMPPKFLKGLPKYILEKNTVFRNKCV